MIHRRRVLSFRVTAREEAAAKDAAQQQGVCLSDFLRDAVLRAAERLRRDAAQRTTRRVTGGHMVPPVMAGPATSDMNTPVRVTWTWAP